MDYKITKLKSGRYSCSEKGVSHLMLNGKNEYWKASFKKTSMDFSKTKTYSVAELGFDKALEMAINQMRRWRDLYNLDEEFEEKERRKVAQLKNVGMSGLNNKRKKSIKRKPQIKRPELNKAIEEYLKRGGKIKKIEPHEYIFNERPFNEADEYLRDNA